jgi:putative acetyltransferase
LNIRGETDRDKEAIRALHLHCFPTADEADLVDQLRQDGDITLSLISETADCLTGHALFSRMKAPFRALGLGPVAVFPEWREQGIAARLIETGLAQAAGAGWEAVFVLGNPDYYGRFGFDAALAAGFQSPYAGMHFMARALQKELPVRSGSVEYPPAFADLG